MMGAESNVTVSAEDVQAALTEALNASLDWSVELYGDGQSSQTIAKALLERST